ncbi:MAG: hypothetical protein Q9182_002067 [Xanthomendoza sp. 2 TL-2023]
MCPDVCLKSLTISDEDRPRPTSPAVAESWEDEEGEEEATSSDNGEPTIPGQSSSVPSAPPPTPISPSARRGDTAWGEFPSTYSPQPFGGRSSPSQASALQRPEKSTATAGRMIAGALGVKAPKRSEEAKAYERAVREKEVKRVAREREERKKEEERKQQARREVWDD